jgi:glycosyltransferase involved in cell wall biosynthesis
MPSIPMNILQVSSARDFGGGETHLLQLVEALRSRGHAVSVAGRRDGPLNPDIKLSFINSADFVTALRLRSVIRNGRFDIVHAHVARDYIIVAAATWGLPRVKVVFTRHLLYPVRRNFLYGRVSGWIAPTAEIRNTIEPLKPKCSAVIPNWVDLEKFPYRPHAFHIPVTIGIIGQIAPHKGHDDAIEALRQLDGGFRLLVAGKGDPSYEAELKKKASGLPVEFVGFVQLPAFFKHTDIVILPSWNEPFGIIVLEAMATGIPVIATGPSEVVCGTRVPPRDPAALAAAIRSIRPEGVVEKARRHVEENFDMKAVIPQIENFYLSVPS